MIVHKAEAIMHVIGQQTAHLISQDHPHFGTRRQGGIMSKIQDYIFRITAWPTLIARECGCFFRSHSSNRRTACRSADLEQRHADLQI
jgi:hypothetical protein